jgi:hypothetical protein
VKAIGIIVLLFVIVLGTVTYVVTKEPSRELDADGRTWVAGYQEWRETVAQEASVARRTMALSTEARNAQLIEPLRDCWAGLTEVGEAPGLLAEVQDAAVGACGEADIALSKNDEFGVAALATTKLHLRRVEEKLRLAEHSLRLALDQPL